MNEMRAHRRRGRLPRIRLGSRSWVSIRPIDAFDRPALSGLYAGLRPESNRRRFLGRARVTDADLDRLAATDGLVGLLRDPGPDDGAIVAHAVLCPDGSGGAEAAFVVRDDLQGRGIGRELVVATAARAARGGARRLVATTYADNVAMRRIFLDAGWRAGRSPLGTGVEEFVLELSDASPEDAPGR